MGNPDGRDSRHVERLSHAVPIAALGVRIDDGSLDAPRLLQLLSRNVVFVLPYREATQSGALFSLLHHGRVFICADVGDLGDFMRRFGLEALLMKDRTADGGNVPWGMGGTPLKEILRLMRKEKWTFLADIEVEYKIPEGSSAVAEVARCVRYCKEALA